MYIADRVGSLFMRGKASGVPRPDSMAFGLLRYTLNTRIPSALSLLTRHSGQFLAPSLTRCYHEKVCGFILRGRLLIFCLGH